MPLDSSNLVGIWCAPGGGWNAYALILRPDGVGRAEMSNCVLTNAWVFDWKLEGNELLVSGREAIELNELQDGVEHLPWGVNSRIRVTLGTVTFDNAETRRTLSLSSALADCLPLEYTAGNPKYDLFAEPDFSWIGRLGRGN